MQIQRRETPALPSSETAAAGAAAQSAALVQARYVMALQRPRDWDVVRDRVLKECRRPGFAAAAEYHKPIGKGVRGPSIRFVETALRIMGNVDTDIVTVYDDDDKRICSVSVSDLEANTTYKKSITVRKAVERRGHKGYEVLGQRTNSKGDTVYIVRATEDDLATKEASLVSKAMRTLGLRIIPGDLVDEAMAVCRQIREQEDAEDPDAARKRLSDAFSAIGVGPGDLAEYLGHALSQTTPAERESLKAIYAAIRDGESTWQDYMHPVVDGETGEVIKDTKGQALKDALKKKQEQRGDVGDG